MRYFTHEDSLKFYKDPQSFDKYTNKQTLKYAIGANMYMPGTQENIFDKLIHNKYHDIGAITLCCEDAISEEMVPAAEENILKILDSIYNSRNTITSDNLPLIFVRVRNVKQFNNFAQKLDKPKLQMLTGFNFPKFNSSNGREYLSILKNLSEKYTEIIYGMPILEDDNIIYKETRLDELVKIQNILKEYDKYILNIRVGGTDFSSRFGLRRAINTPIYDVKVISDCLLDILNIFLRTTEKYVVSGPVWEYFSWDESSPAICGLKKELDLDIQNGFQGKTIIHPSQINIVNKKYIVDYDEYNDAINIINSSGGVFKGSGGNRMNEVAPHTEWARKIIARAKIFGVSDKEVTFAN